MGDFSTAADFIQILQSVPEDQRAPLVQQYLKDVRERQQRLDDERAAEKMAEKMAEVEKLKADNNRKLADLRRAANERLAVKSWCDTLLVLATLIAVPGLIAADRVFRSTEAAAKAGTATFFGVVVVIIGAALSFVYSIGVIDCQAKVEWEQFNSYLKIAEGDGHLALSVESPVTRLDIIRPVSSVIVAVSSLPGKIGELRTSLVGFVRRRRV
ncbi:hypothetical protein HDV00_010378 [Rhizophlyctis rosea]|nr:hypothetical protein HDV00_010378 [Rhizophlyctis rosea]